VNVMHTCRSILIETTTSLCGELVLVKKFYVSEKTHTSELAKSQVKGHLPTLNENRSANFIFQ
jgi:hypothetical protein